MRSANSLRLDTNLLIALVALVEERNVSRAAQREALSQPSMSRLLARLRQITGDPLLRRAGNALQPTERALELAEAAREIIARTASLLHAQRYDPAQDAALVRIAASDYGEAMILSRVVAQISRAAPRMTIQVSNWDADTIENLRVGNLDMALGVADESLDRRVTVTPLRRERLVGLARIGHPLLKKTMKLADYAGQGHVVVSTGAGGVVAGDAVLRKHGLERTIVCRTRHFLGAARLVSQSNLLTAAPERLARWLAGTCEVRTFTLPFPSPEFQYSLLAATRLDASPRHRWLTDLFVRTTRTKGAK